MIERPTQIDVGDVAQRQPEMKLELGNIERRAVERDQKRDVVQ